jgi:serine/threonine protein kinase
MDNFFEQLRDALKPEYVLEGVLGRGGMGTVFLARDVALDCPVAIKAIRPEDASAAAVQRFQTEAQTLAKLRHPHIVRVHFCSIARGLGVPFYVMDYLDGKTLEQRLDESGAMPEEDVVRLGDQLLDALTTAHRNGVIHRDIKPSNVFLENGEVILTDFGIAKRLDRGTDGLTGTKRAPFTPLYSPLEQREGREVSPRTDLWALGAVLYEALTKRVWLLEPLGNKSWDGVSRRFRAVLSRALAESAEDRWADAETFRGALVTASKDRPSRPVVLAVAVAVIAILILVVPRGPPAMLRIASLKTADTGHAAMLADSLPAHMARRVAGFPDLTVLGPDQRGRARQTVTGTLSVAGPTLRVTLWLSNRPFSISTPGADWRAAGDDLADSLLLRVFGGSVLDSALPVRVLPRSPAGLQAFLRAEKLFAAARWREAYVAYGDASTVDSTCLLCVWRHTETRRWLGLDDDTAEIRQAITHLALFPLAYQSLLRVDTLPLLARFDTLDDLHNRWRTFLFGEFRYGDELMHRGPLIGRNRGDAARHFQDALKVRPDFAPAIEHQLWLAILDEDEARARVALDALTRINQVQQLTSGIPELLQVAFAWRFLPSDEAATRTDQAIDQANRKGIGNLDVGARYLNGFTAPAGALWIGRRLENDPGYGRSALIAQVFGHVELGRLDSAWADLERLRALYPDPAMSVLWLELEGLRALFIDETRATETADTLIADLMGTAIATNLPVGLRQRAGWLAEMLRCRTPAASSRARFIARPGGAYPDALALLLRACLQAGAGQLQAAVDSTERLTELTAAPIRAFPIFRSMLHLLRADWLLQLKRRGPAGNELLWAENFDQAALPTGDPQPMDVDWAFRPWARWRRLQLLGSGASREDRCPLSMSVERLWRGGEPAFAAIADSASRLSTAWHCRASGGGT